MSLSQQIRSLILNKSLNSPLSQQQQQSHQPFSTAAYIAGFLFCLSYYIFAPSLFPSFYQSTMFTKRPDKHTTGLINMRNDCFANSSLQAYSALPGLTDYLNQILSSFNSINQIIKEHDVDLSHIIKSKGLQNIANTKFKSNNIEYTFEMPLHFALANLVKKLQETQMTTRTISVWTFLHSLEKIFNAKISKSQHDAQELTQLINETLENENINAGKVLKQLKLTSFGKHFESLEIPEFPFNGLLLSQMTCLDCKHVSKPHFSPFLTVTLHAPQKFSSDLETLLNDNESESIEGYQCLKCRISRIVQHNSSFGKELPEGHMSKLIELNNDGAFFINEDLPEELETYIKSYNEGDLDISKITSTVFKKTQILKPPKVFSIHLSRSSFNGIDITRNSCRVSFKDSLSLSIGKEYLEELKKFQTAASEEEEVVDLSNIKSKILTTDVNDMEDEEVQREDIDERGEDDDDDDDDTTENENDSTDDAGNDDDDEDDEEDDDDDSSSLTSNETGQQSVMTSTTLREKNTKDDLTSKTSSDISARSVSSKVPETLNNAPITEDQTRHLKRHFRKFKFNDNDVYRYRLKAMIRHQGSHTQGHYECYKRKPLYVKDKEGTIFKLSPEISDEALGNAVYNVTKITQDDQSTEPTGSSPSNTDPTVSATREAQSGTSEQSTNSRLRGFSFSLNGSSGTASATSSNEGPNANEDLEIKGHGNFRRKFSNIMGRRPSVVQADPQNANIQEIIHSGLTTPAELFVDDLEPSYFSSSAIEKSLKDHQAAVASGKPKQNSSKVKMKKIPSLLKHPYWRISDATITEVSRASVLCEMESVYMLYYERVDRKQVKH